MNQAELTYLRTRDRFEDPDVAAAYVKKKNISSTDKNRREIDSTRRFGGPGKGMCVKLAQAPAETQK